ncbi:hypothetical protein EXS62_00655 [Candidatus Kaiserbacteria bacterium]|nr:hypothetical protein [Candidatus Kaiserbacteria bacterium]
MKYFAFTIATLLCFAAPALAAAPSELRITADGTFSASNVVVMQKAGSNLFSRVTWGSIYLRLVVVPSSGGVSAVVTKNNGGAASIEEIKEGDILSVKGTLAPGGDSLVINAREIRDLSLNREPKNLVGTVKSVDYAGSFVLTNKTFGATKVVIDGNTLITKGVRTISLGEVSVGDKILAVSGTYDFDNKVLNATSTVVYQDPAVFKTKNFEGKLKSLSGTALPTTLVVTVAKNSSTGIAAGDYTVYLPATATVKSKNKTATTLQRYTIGDSVRLSGTIRPSNLLEIDSTSLLNLSF